MKRLYIILITVIILLLIPFVAMQFSNDVNWSMFDFLVASILLFGTGLLIEFLLRKVKNKQVRIALISIISFVLIVIWIELAVGVFGAPFAGS